MPTLTTRERTALDRARRGLLRDTPSTSATVTRLFVKGLIEPVDVLDPITGRWTRRYRLTDAGKEAAA
jgi:hypothetical protein